jgi:O-antigen ligase
MPSNKTHISKGTITLAHLAWIAMFCGIMLWGFGSVKAGEIGNTKNWYRIGLVIFAGIAGTTAFLRAGNRVLNYIPGPLILLFIYGIVALLSSILVPEHAFYAMWKALEIIICLIITAAILGHKSSQPSVHRSYKIIVTIFTIMLIVYWVEGALMPSKAFLPSRGIIPYTFFGYLPYYNGNSLAFLSAFLSVVTIANITRSRSAARKLLLSLFLLACIATLIMGQSRTSLVGFIFASMCFFFFDRRYTTLALLTSVSFILLIIGGLSGLFEDYFMRGQSQELFTSLSGRTHGWQAAWELFKQSPLVGHGFAAAARIKILGTAGASTMHGSVFDVIVGTGLFGLIPWLSAVILTFVAILRLRKSKHPWFQSMIGRSVHAEMIAVLALLLIRSLTSSALAFHDHGFMLFLSLVAYTQCMTRETKKHRASLRQQHEKTPTQ